MRRVLLPLLLLALLPLLAGTWLAWQHRFKIDPAHPHLTLRDLGGHHELERGARWDAASSGEQELVLDVDRTSRPVVQLLPLPLSEPVGFLMFDVAVRAEGLERGEKPWCDGRLMIEWHMADGSMEPQYLASARGDGSSNWPCVVARPADGMGLPVLRVEQLGSSGTFHLLRCNIDVVRESAWWPVVRWLLLGGWFAWAAALAAWGHTSGLGRPLLAAAVWVFCVSQWAVPGPWPLTRPMAPLFEVGNPANRASFATPSPRERKLPAPQVDQASALPEEPTQALGELPFGGSILLEIKDHIRQARPLFHMLLFFGPALVFAFLVGRWKSVVFTASLATAIECSQYLFGFGFDSSDWYDLSFDALGVALALWIHSRFVRWWQARRGKGGEPAEDKTSASQPA